MVKEVTGVEPGVGPSRPPQPCFHSTYRVFACRRLVCDMFVERLTSGAHLTGGIHELLTLERSRSPPYVHQMSVSSGTAQSFHLLPTYILQTAA
jgi:hypothetical protein